MLPLHLPVDFLEKRHHCGASELLAPWADKELPRGCRKPTRASERLERLRASNPEPIESTRRIDVPPDLEPYWIKRGTFPDFVILGRLSGRDLQGLIDLTNNETAANFIAVLLFLFTIKGETDRTPYFESLEDARYFVESDASASPSSMLFCAIVDLNPDAYPEGAEAVRAVWQQLKVAADADIAAREALEVAIPSEAATESADTPIPPAKPKRVRSRKTQ